MGPLPAPLLRSIQSGTGASGCGIDLDHPPYLPSPPPCRATIVSPAVAPTAAIASAITAAVTSGTAAAVPAVTSTPTASVASSLSLKERSG